MNLDDWLNYIGGVHRTEIDLSLERIKQVAQALNVDHFSCPVISVAGTNGKGSCVATLETMLLTAGFRVACYTSPHLFSYNERICIQGVPVADEAICAAFKQIEQARQEISLTFFEFTTLAAFLLFKAQTFDVIILEVGLGGRLDAVNIIDADIAIITTIALDHTDRLGNTRNSIAYEKSGIFRSGKPAVCGDFEIPKNIVEIAAQLMTPLYTMRRDYGYEFETDSWSWWSENRSYTGLPIPGLELQNVATALKALELLPATLAISEQVLHQALAKLQLAGRWQIMPGPVEYIFDVAHNPAGGAWLANRLINRPCQGRTRAVIGMLADKDQQNTLINFSEIIAHWYLTDLQVPRGGTAIELAQCLKKLHIEKLSLFTTVTQALQAAVNDSGVGDRVVIFGSFHTVSEALTSGVMQHEN